MSTNATLFSADSFVEGALRAHRKPYGSQKAVALGAGFSAGTMSRAERGFDVNFTSAILIGMRLGLLKPGVYDLADPRIRRIVRYMRVSAQGGHAKGWASYCQDKRPAARKAA